MQHRRLLTPLLLAVVALGACSADDDAPAPEVPPGPLDQLAAALGIGEDTTQQTLVEEAVSACMAEEGFEYIPVVPDPGEDGTDDEGMDAQSREFVEQFGYGLSTEGAMEAMNGAVVTPPRDLNEEALAAMSEQEREAWSLALWGAGGAADAPATRHPDGCQGWAREQVADSGPHAEAFELLVAGAQQTWELAYRDQRVAEADAAWAACMADAGHPGLRVPADAPAAFSDALNAATAEPYAEITESSSAEEKEAARLAAERARAELADDEIALALDDLDCNEEVGHAAVLATVVAERQEEFFDTHQAEFAALWEFAGLAEAAEG